MLYTIYTEGNISDKDHRMWYKLNCKSGISVLTTVGETDAKRIFGQGSFGAALASSLNIGCAIYDVTMCEFITDLGPMSLNCLIFQDDIVKMNESLENA